ncbi:MAG: Yip1 family protein [Hyphomonadaceae bacterium]|nr:Yip1 family protein [Hyphomonadaceae bacterium]
MSADNENPRPRFDAAQARARMDEARHKAEFILSRAYGLLREPKAEWLQIKGEETTIPNIMLGYVAPLAAVPPICGLIGAFVFGLNYGGVDLRPSIDDALVGALVSFVASAAMVFALGILVNVLAENFAGDRNDLAAQKVAAYSMTPAFLSGVFSLWPPLWWLSLFAIAASVFLLYRGLPILMKAPEDQALGYTATVAIAGMVAFVLLFSLSSCVTGAGGL